MEDKITIRRAEMGDLEKILVLAEKLSKEEYKKYGENLNFEWLRQQERKIFTDSLNDADSLIAVAQSDDRIIAYLRASLYRDDQMLWRVGRGAELYDIFIEEEFRSQKIGARLMDAFLDWCQTKKADYVLVFVASLNGKAAGFYKKLGFKDYQIILEKKIR